MSPKCYHYMGNWAFWDISVLRHMIIVVDTQGTSNWKSIDNNKIYPSLNRTKIFTFQKRLFFCHAIAKTFICRHGTFKRNDTCRQQMHPSETWPALMKRLVGFYPRHHATTPPNHHTTTPPHHHMLYYFPLKVPTF